MFNSFNLGLGNLMLLSDAETRSISAENPTGEKGGDADYPTICGTGTEDYFGGAWCFIDKEKGTTTYSTPFLGYPLYRQEAGEVPKHGLYRWHIMDPIRFKRDLKVTVQALGWWPNGKFEPLTDDIASVGYWYQREPHAPFPKMLPVHERWAR